MIFPNKHRFEKEFKHVKSLVISSIKEMELCRDDEIQIIMLTLFNDNMFTAVARDVIKQVPDEEKQTFKENTKINNLKFLNYLLERIEIKIAEIDSSR